MRGEWRAEYIAALSRAGNAARKAKLQLRDERIAVMTQAGHTAAQIAEILGVSERTVARARARRGIAQPFTGKPLSEEEIDRASALLDDGASFAEVARTLRRSLPTIKRRFPGRSICTPGMGPEYRRMMDALDAIGYGHRKDIA